MVLTFCKLHPHFVDKVSPVDLRQVHDRETLAEIRAAMDEYAVLVFHDQPFTDAEHLAFAQRLDGELHTKTGSSALYPSRLGSEALADEHPEMGARAPRSFGGTPVSLHVYVDDVDATVKTATTAGAKVLRPVEDKFYGDRSGTIEDPFGYHWHVATHTEDVAPDEMERRAAALAR